MFKLFRKHHVAPIYITLGSILNIMKMDQKVIINFGSNSISTTVEMLKITSDKDLIVESIRALESDGTIILGVNRK